MKTAKLQVRDMCLIGIFTAMITVLGQLSIPMPYGVPMTLQTLTIPLAGVVLGARRGTIATLVYVILGAVGLPVFAGFAGGIGVLFGATGGFILSFPLMALAAGIGAEKGKVIPLACGLVIGAVINYLCGMVMFSLVTASSLWTAFAACVLPFIPTAIVKIILAGALGAWLKNILVKGKIAI